MGKEERGKGKIGREKEREGRIGCKRGRGKDRMGKEREKGIG